MMSWPLETLIWRKPEPFKLVIKKVESICDEKQEVKTMEQSVTSKQSILSRLWLFGCATRLDEWKVKAISNKSDE